MKSFSFTRIASRLACALLAVCWTTPHAKPAAVEPLPVIDHVEIQPLLANVRDILASGHAALPALSAPDMADLRQLLREAPPKANAAERVQRLLDPYCLLSVTINAESRVKAVRGPAPARLVKGTSRLALIKVWNEAGVTQPVKVTAAGEDLPGWLKASISPIASGNARLSGRKLEYAILRLRALESGKREATLKFDVGQGTQDLGFRAEVPVLFMVDP